MWEGDKMKNELARIIWEYKDWVHQYNQELNEENKSEDEIPHYKEVSFDGFCEYMTKYL